MSDPVQRSIEYYGKGCNCAQAVLAGFCAHTGLDEDRSLALGSLYGGGIGGRKELCGAVSGALMALGCIRDYGKPVPEDRARYKQDVAAFLDAFDRVYGSHICRELLQDIADNGGRGYQKPCTRYVEGAARILTAMQAGEG